MTLTLRQRILLTIVPLLVIVAVLGSVGVALLMRLGNSADAFFLKTPNEKLPDENDQQEAYFGKPDGLLEMFNEIKTVSGQILSLNQNNMEQASQEARRISVHSLNWFIAGLVAAIAIAIFS